MQNNNTLKNNIDDFKYCDYIDLKNQLKNTQKELEEIKNKINNNESLLQQQILAKLTNNEHLMHQLLKSYYDKETDQIKVYDNLITTNMVKTKL